MGNAHALRVMSIMAHQDDFEFNAGGSFALLRQVYGDAIEMKVVAMSRGAAGHHELSPDQTFARRDAEARRSAAVIGASYECLTQLDGTHVPGRVMITENLLGGLWNTIRAFEPDAVFCPPVTRDPLAGVHVDHENTANAVRMVVYLVCAPHVFPTLDGPMKRRVRIPLVVNVDDVYACEGEFHVRQDVTACYDTKLRMALCHESQIFEWLPFTGGRDDTLTPDEWVEAFRARHLGVNQRYGQDDGVLSEYFRITRWGRAPDEGELAGLFPGAIGEVNLT